MTDPAVPEPDATDPTVSDPTVSIQSVEILRMPGIPREDGFAVDSFSPGVTVILGPNGSGKSSLLTAIQEILWFDGSGGANINARCTVQRSDGRWVGERSDRAVNWQHDGVASAAPEFGASDVRHRYRLALDELVRGTEADAKFGADVRNAMAGGFDLSAAAEAAEFRTPISGHQNAARELRAAIESAAAARSAERDLDHAVRSELVDHRSRLRNARADEDRLKRLALAADHGRAQTDLEQLELEESALPLTALRACGSSDLDRLKELTARVTVAADDVDEARAEQNALAAGARVVEPGVQSRLRELAERAATLEHDLRSAERDCAAELERQRSAGRSGESSQPKALAIDDSVEIEADAIAANGHQLAARSAQLSERRATLHPATDQDLKRAELVDTARGHLRGWLAAGSEPAAAPSAGWMPWAGLGAAALLTAALAALQHPAWGLALGPLAGIAFATVRGQRQNRPANAGSTGQERPLQRDAFVSLEIEAPPAWTVSEVSQLLATFDSERETLTARRADRTRGADLEAKIAALDGEVEAHNIKRRAFETKLGVSAPDGDAWLPLIVSALRREQDSAHVLAGATGRRDHAQSGLDAALAESASLTAAYELTAAGNAESLRRQEEQLGAWHDAQLKQARVALHLTNKLEPALTAAEEERRAFFTDRGLDDDDRAGLDELLARQPRHAVLVNRRIELEATRRESAGQLDDHPELLGRSLEEIESERVAIGDPGDQREREATAVALIEDQQVQALGGHASADASAEIARAEGVLDRLRSLLVERSVGDRLTDMVRDAASAAQVPAVVERSRKLLVEITAGRFDLRPPATDGAEFEVHDTHVGITKSVTDLSTGERVQVLLAVRLGFLEEQESARLPLLLDETLGTSDDARAGALLDALIGLAREGRQLIYCTAQHDEAAKWAARLRDTDIPMRLIDLQTIREPGTTPVTELDLAPIEIKSVPAPDGATHAAYGVRLGVPKLDPARTHADQIHLWHLLRDPEDLYRLLKRGIKTVGSARLYRKYAGGAGAGPDAASLAFATAIHPAIEALYRAWREGRAQPVEMDVLEKSGAVSETFRERIAELLAEVEHDPVRLLDALEDGEIKGWRSNNTDKLRIAFETANALPVGDSRSAETLRLIFRAQLDQSDAGSAADETWVAQMVAALPE